MGDTTKPVFRPLRRGTAGEEVDELLDVVEDEYGVVPNDLATLAHAPRVLEACLVYDGALEEGRLAPRVRAAVVLAVSGVLGARYVAAAAAARARTVGLDDADIAACLRGGSADTRLGALLGFARVFAVERGLVGQPVVDAVREAGWSEAEIIEACAGAGQVIFMHAFNTMNRTALDFPAVDLPEPVTA